MKFTFTFDSPVSQFIYVALTALLAFFVLCSIVGIFRFFVRIGYFSDPKFWKGKIGERTAHGHGAVYELFTAINYRSDRWLIFGGMVGCFVTMATTLAFAALFGERVA